MQTGNSNAKDIKNIPASKFVFCNQNVSINSDQVFGKYSSNIANILKRFFKNPISIIAFVIFLTFVLLTIIVPAATGDAWKTPILDFVWAKNLRPRIPGIVSGHYETVLTYDQFEQYSKLYPGFIIEKLNQTSGLVRVTINPYAIDALKNFYPVFGTDSGAIDLWSKLWYSTARSMSMAAIVSICTILIGVTYGAISGWFAGKWIDTLMMRFVEVLSSVPTILFILGIAFATSSTSGQITNNGEIVALILLGWTGPASLTRVYIMKVKDQDYIIAAKSLGASTMRVIFLHALPNFLGRLMVQFVIMIPGVIGTDATLIFFGVKDPSIPTLGLLTNFGNNNLLTAPYLLWTSVFVTVMLISSTWFIAMGINDAIDPRNARRN